MTALAAGQALKKSARNPDSLVIEAATASDDGKTVCLSYRAQNGFGGMNRETLVFRDGAPLESAASWNRHCLGPMRDVTSEVKVGASMS